MHEISCQKNCNPSNVNVKLKSYNQNYPPDKIQMSLSFSQGRKAVKKPVPQAPSFVQTVGTIK